MVSSFWRKASVDNKPFSGRYTKATVSLEASAQVLGFSPTIPIPRTTKLMHSSPKIVLKVALMGVRDQV